MIKQWKVNYPAISGPELRKVYLYLPPGYKHSPEVRYPVLYCFDGQNLFWDDEATYGRSWHLGKFLDAIHAQVIVACLACSSNPESDRLSEYAPFYYDDPTGPYEAHGEDTMDWFINGFKPFIDDKFRTLPDREHTFIMGSSMGGIMALYAVLAHNDVYSRAIALSPTMNVDYEALLNLVHETDIDPNTVIYMDYGENEFDDEDGSREMFTNLAQALSEKNTILTTRIVKNGEHSEASWEKQLPFCINTILYEV